jgi:hypothetical protein
MYHLIYAILIAHHIPITDHRDIHILLEVIDASEISFTGERLLVCTPMYSDKIGSSILESLHKISEKLTIFPTETSFHRDRDFDSL